jgi:hypothetical protein
MRKDGQNQFIRVLEKEFHIQSKEDILHFLYDSNKIYSLISGINKNEKASELYKNFALLLQEFFISTALQIDNYANETLKQKDVQLQFIEFLFAHKEQFL